MARVHAPKYVVVTGSAPDYLRVRLKTGVVGYVPISAVHLIKPTDQTFAVIRDSPVYEKPSLHSKEVAQIHRAGHVHVTGIALGYMRVRMRSGIEGFVPLTAFE